MKSWNLSSITDELAIGGCFARKRASRLSQELGIKAVVDLRDEERDDEADLRSHGIEFLRTPVLGLCVLVIAYRHFGTR